MQRIYLVLKPPLQWWQPVTTPVLRIQGDAQLLRALLLHANEQVSTQLRKGLNLGVLLRMTCNIDKRSVLLRAILNRDNP